MSTFIDKTPSLPPAVCRIICDKATEQPNTGTYNSYTANGTYLCRRCGLALFRAHSQFSAGCGWPSFDENIADAVQQIPDNDGRRMEIICHRCDAHLGHIFTGEGFTEKNQRYCVNSLSLDFVNDNHVIDTEEAIVAGGCFWGVDYYLKQLPGVLKVEAGYIGGTVDAPTYNQVCSGTTGHYEAVRVIFNIEKIDYRTVLKRFFEIHDPAQHTGQGPDLGSQYYSAVFYYNEIQHQELNYLIQALRKNNIHAVTRLLPAQPFWPAEDYHQDYYTKHHKLPYCHHPVSRFK